MNKQKWIRRISKRVRGGNGKTGGGFRSGAYHRHFEGYAEYEARDANGRTRIRRVYTGMYYEQDLDKGQRLKLRLGLGFLWALCAFLFGFAATRGLGANRCWYVALGQFGSLVGLGWMLTALFNYYTAPSRMTIGERRGASDRLKTGSLIASLALALTAFLTLLYALLNGDAFGRHLLCAGAHLLSAALSTLINRLEANVPYLETPSEEAAPEDAARID